MVLDLDCSTAVRRLGAEPFVGASRHRSICRFTSSSFSRYAHSLIYRPRCFTVTCLDNCRLSSGPRSLSENSYSTRLIYNI